MAEALSYRGGCFATRAAALAGLCFVDYANLMFRNGSWRVFLAGVLCGTIFMAVVGTAWVLWQPIHGLSDADVGLDDWVPVRSAEDADIYDRCLFSGNTAVACDAMMRVIGHERAAEIAKEEEAIRRYEATMKEEIAKKLAAGLSKREVVQWAIENGFVSSALSDAVGISLTDIQDGKY